MVQTVSPTKNGLTDDWWPQRGPRKVGIVSMQSTTIAANVAVTETTDTTNEERREEDKERPSYNDMGWHERVTSIYHPSRKNGMNKAQ